MVTVAVGGGERRVEQSTGSLAGAPWSSGRGDESTYYHAEIWTTQTTCQTAEFTTLIRDEVRGPSPGREAHRSAWRRSKFSIFGPFEKVESASDDYCEKSSSSSSRSLLVAQHHNKKCPLAVVLFCKRVYTVSRYSLELFFRVVGKVRAVFLFVLSRSSSLGSARCRAG